MNQIHHNSQIPNGHILVVACPLQGHAAPLMKLSHQINKVGTKVTFLTKRALTTSSTTECENSDNGIRIISILDDLELKSSWKDQEKLHESVQRVMPGYLRDLLEKSNQSPKIGDRISGVILDSPLAWMSDIPKKMGLKIAVFWCSSPGCLALGLKIPQLIESKFIDNDGTPLKNEKINLLPNLPPMAPTDLMWHFPGDTNVQTSIFHVIKGVSHHMINADWILCNWFHELHPLCHNLTPTILSIGPLLANGQSAGSFHSEDSTCLTWLDKQPKCSVVYVAFGSTSRFTQQQLDELASGLELMGRPFLWVANSTLNNKSATSYSYKKHLGDRGKIVEWAPQEEVLGHPSIACFISHCGWSSLMESLSMGFLCFVGLILEINCIQGLAYVILGELASG
ncbi:UDP-glucuronosyl and UDP-glucosyl transferase [Handroanthus impetiginosus]|uniref:UDP-glucuronosyl and UDP-glucosyl transferase n=1 Tax=Handroanthus impetiginosus TaxID=429701 RepID=A0A2G9G8B7_9LAMI|nr:UDP-glucuronosyl and UDP-glucosyl transferase [Handroanthus impetiginosus]